MIAQSNPQTGAETRARILEAAAELFHEDGFEATGVATILRHAGAHSGSLYHFFSGKEALLVGVMERHLNALRPTLLDPAERASDDPIERVFALLELYRRNLRITECRGGCPVGNLALEVGDRKPEVRALIEEYFARWVGRVRAWLERAGDRLPADVDRAALSRLVLSVLEGGIMQARAGGEIEPYDASVAQLRGCVALLMDRADRERGSTRAIARGPEPVSPRERSADETTGPAPDRPAIVAASTETAEPGPGPLPDLPGDLSPDLARDPSSEEDESTLDRSAWRNW